jgi:peptide/nickel transport system substrate-binding protein/oligopeptide transport system substrate-binding protein
MAYKKLDDYIKQMPAKEAAFFNKVFSRRTLMGGAAVATAGAFTGMNMFATGPASAQTPEAPALDLTDAAPPENQVIRFASATGGARVLDFYEEVYGRPGVADLWSDPLVRLSKEFEIIPGAATDWTVSEDGMSFVFNLDQDLMWSDGNPVTAADYVKTFQYAADPEHAWDFSWFWLDDIVNFEEAIGGTVPLEEIGVKVGANEYQVVFTTKVPAPYLPAKLLYSLPLSKAALESTGPLYNTNPETTVSAGPFILEEWVLDQQIVYKRNEAYTGKQQIPLQRIIVKFADAGTFFNLYDADEIDYMDGPGPAELLIMEGDRPDEIFQGVGDFACLYFFFDVNTAPWDNKLVRQAFSHVIDREAMKQQIWTSQANPAYSYMMPGFPDANEEGLKDIQKFDPDLAKQLLAEAGYPDGEGFPSLTLQFRGLPSPIETSTVNAFATMVKDNLNIDIEIQTIDRDTFYTMMNAKPTEISFGWVSYGMDYFDASNMLSVWKSGGRHSWNNADFDAKVEEATAFIGDPAQRTALFQEAERMLVEDCPAIWAYHPTPIQLIKPYIKGPALDPDSNGIAAIHWPSFSTTSTVLTELYISSDAPEGRS